jgi:hypothetical protein
LLVALANKLWKGVRVGDLEERVIDTIAARLGKQRGDVYVALAGTFDEVAASAGARLMRSTLGAT